MADEKTLVERLRETSSHAAIRPRLRAMSAARIRDLLTEAADRIERDAQRILEFEELLGQSLSQYEMRRGARPEWQKRVRRALGINEFPGPDCEHCHGSGRQGPDTWCPECKGQGTKFGDQLAKADKEPEQYR